MTCTLVLPDLLGFLRKKHDAKIAWDTQIRKFSEAYLLISRQLTFCPQKVTKTGKDFTGTDDGDANGSNKWSDN